MQEKCGEDRPSAGSREQLWGPANQEFPPEGLTLSLREVKQIW